MAHIEELAAAAFGSLTPAEKALLTAVTTGAAADGGYRPRATGGPDAGPSRMRYQVRADLIRWLCTDKQAAAAVDVKGLILVAAAIGGRLDLVYVTVPFPIALVNCAIPDGIDFSHADLKLLNLDGSDCGPLLARGANVRGGILLTGGCRIRGRVDLSGATVVGDVECTRARFLNRGAVAFSAERAKIAGALRMDEGCVAYGEVRLAGATIGPGLDLTGGTFLNSGGQTLYARGVTVADSVLMGDGMRTNGTINLERATIEGDLIFDQARFIGPSANGVNLSRAQIKGRAQWTKVVLSPQTRLDLTETSVGTLWDDAASWPDPRQMALNGFVYGTIAPQAAGIAERLALLDKLEPFTPQPYTQLAETLRRYGHDREALHVTIAREDALQRSDNLSRPLRACKWLFGLATGHGYKTYRLLWVPAFFVVAGWMLFGWGYRARLIMPTQIAAYSEFISHGTLPRSYPTFNPLVYSLDTFLPLTDFHQEDFWGPVSDSARHFFTPELSYGKVLTWYLALHILAGWIFAVLGAAGLLAKKT